MPLLDVTPYLEMPSTLQEQQSFDLYPMKKDTEPFLVKTFLWSLFKVDGKNTKLLVDPFT